MDPPESSSGSMVPLQRRKSLLVGHLSVIEKQYILNMYTRLRKSSNTTSAVSEIVDTLGISKSTVYRVIKEYKGTGRVSDSKQSTGRTSLVSVFDETVKNTVRRFVHSFYYNNELPTLDKILSKVNTCIDLPQMSRSTLYKLMKHLNFKYMKRSRKSILIERDDIICWRRKFLKQIQAYRKEGNPIFYVDETWLNEGHTKPKVWIDLSVTHRRQAFLEGLSTGLKNPPGEGRRLIILHIGSEDGFVNDGLLLFEGKKSSDYHEEMNATVFEDWFNNILNKLPVNAVIVMDNASYHSRKSEKVPSSSSKKIDMQNWLASKDIEFDDGMVRSELLQLIQLHKNKYNAHVIDEMAAVQRKIVLRLPPYHCELNAIELVWAKIKNEVASKNCTFKLNDVRQLLIEAIQSVTTENWRNCIQHVIAEEDKMKDLDVIVDNLVEPLIISIGDSEDSSDSDDIEDY